MITRREAFRSIGNGGAISVLATAAVASVSCQSTEVAAAAVDDPFLDLLIRYQAKAAELNALPDPTDEEVHRLTHEAHGLLFTPTSVAVPITTPAGAAAALREALAEDGIIDSIVEKLVQAVLTFLESTSE